MLEMVLEPLMAWLAAMPAGVRGVRIHATLDTGAVWRFSCGVNQGRAPVAQRAAAHAAARLDLMPMLALHRLRPARLLA